MKPRQYKKLCKKAKDILVGGGLDEDWFSVEDEYREVDGKTQWFRCWGLNTGPDYWGECDWFDAWFILSDRVAIDTADWESCTGDDSDRPYKTSITDTIGILRHGRLMHA